MTEINKLASSTIAEVEFAEDLRSMNLIKLYSYYIDKLELRDTFEKFLVPKAHRDSGSDVNHWIRSVLMHLFDYQFDFPGEEAENLRSFIAH